jgi:hypothetical protein
MIIKVGAYIAAVVMTFLAIPYLTEVSMEPIVLVLGIGVIYLIPFGAVTYAMDRWRGAVRPHRARPSRKH